MLDIIAVREWAVTAGQPTGKRGRVSRSTIVAFLLAHPRTLRSIAAQTGVAVGQRGRVTTAQAEAVAQTL